MKTETQTESNLQRKVDELKANGIGNVENEKNRLKAMINLEQAKKIEQSKKKKGYRWMQYGKTNAYVHPKRFELYKNKGFKFI